MKRAACALFLALLCASVSRAQEPAPEPVQEPAPEPVQEPAPERAPEPTQQQPAPELDAREALEALKAEVAGLRERLDDAETAALATETVDASAASTPLRVYGFMDFGLDKFFLSDPGDDGFALLRNTDASTFVFGNLNVYLDARPLERLHALIELRFSLAPHGEELSLGPPFGTSYERIDSIAFDFSSPSSQSQLRLGSIFIERALSEYKFAEYLTLQWGLFLTPFGIWNLDHGSPTLISLILPMFIAAQMVPTRLLGIHLYGSALFGRFELGYAVHVSNGRTPLDVDLTEDKAAGARVFLARDSDGLRWALGASGYFGRYVDEEKQIAIRGDNVFDWVPTVDYDEQVLGFDAALDVGDLRVRCEAVLRWIHYNDGKHERIFNYTGGEAYLPNRLEWNAYALVAYRTPWRLEPYAELELSERSYILPRWAGKSRASENGLSTSMLSVGLNVEVTPYTLVKAQVGWLRAQDDILDTKIADLPLLFLRVVSSF